MDEGAAEEFKAFPVLPSDRTHRNVPRTLLHRDTGFRQRHNDVPIEFQWAAEDKLVLKDYEEMKCQLPGVPTRSTFLMVFSPDGKRVASTHGNHNIYVTDLTSGKNINTLTGHPRTPWCIAFHPSSNQILASGCLGGQVRVWDLHGGSEIWITKSQTVIASIAFHPTERMLVIATYNELYFWDWSQPEPYAKCHTSNEKEKVRYVSFDPLGCKLITGISNAPAVASQWDRVGPPTTAGNPAQTQGASTSAGLPHDPDQRRITICYRSLVEQYEQLVQRYYDLTRSRATPTMDRGTDPMDVDEASRLRHAGCTSGSVRCQRPGCSMLPAASATGTGSRNPASSETQPGSSQPSSSQASWSQTSVGAASSLPGEQHPRWRGWMNANRFCQTGMSHTASLGIPRSSETATSTRSASESTGMGSGLYLVNSSESIHDLNVPTEHRAVIDAYRARASSITSSFLPTTTVGSSSLETSAVGSSFLDTSAVGSSFLDTSAVDSSSLDTSAIDSSSSTIAATDTRSLETHTIGPNSPAMAATSPPISERESRYTGSHLEQNRSRRNYCREPNISRRNFMRMVREHHRLYCSPRRDNSEATGQSAAASNQAPPNSEETRGERRSPSHIRTYDVSRTGPVLPSFSSDAEPPRSPERPRRFFFSQRSAFQPQAPRSAATEQSYAFLEERARRLDSLTRGLYQRRSAGRTPPPPPPPPPHETADIGVRYGIQLLSRHIDNMQRLCRARLEILQLQQIRRMWEDLQLQIRSLHVASRGAGSDPPPPLPPRRYPPSDPIPTPKAAGEGRARFDFCRYLGYRSQLPSRLCRSSRRSADQRRSVAWRHYSGRRPGQEAPSFRHRAGADAVTTTESSTQSGVGDEVEAVAESGPSNGAASREATAEAEGTARGTKRNHREIEGEVPVEVPADVPAAEASGANDAQPTADQGRSTTQSLRSMIARLESLVRQQRDQRELAASVSPGVDSQEAPPPAPAAGATLSAEERLASALQNEEYESGRLYRSTLGRQSRLEDWEFARESTRLRARQVLSLMVESLTQFFEENGLSHNTPHAVLDDQIYNLFILLQLALELTDLLLAQLASTRRELEHQWVHRLRSPVALEASETASFREEAQAGGRHSPRRGRQFHCARRPLFHSRVPPLSDSGSARTAGTIPDGTSQAGAASAAPTQTSRPLLSFRRLFSHDLHLLPVSRTASSSFSTLLSQAQSALAQGTLSQSIPPQSSLPQSSPPSSDSTRPATRTRVGSNAESGPERPRRFVRVGSGPRTPRFGGDAFRVQERPAERRHDEREFMVQVRRYQNAAPPVPAVRVNDVPVADPSAMGQPQLRPRAQQPWTLPSYGDADPDAGPWRPQRFLHPRYRLEQAAPDTPYEIAGGGEGFNILRVMGPAFATEHVVLADSPVMPNHRIQAWDFTHLYIPDITDVEKNVVAAECKIHNDASVDVASDGKLLVTLLPSGRLSMTTMLGIYSLQWETLGQCLYTTRFDQNAVSVSLSPVSRHLLVGLASRRVGAIMTDLHTMAQIFRLDKVACPGAAAAAGGAAGNRGRLCHLRDIEQGREQPFMSINCIRWAPVAGQGLVFGTNNGQLKVLR